MDNFDFIGHLAHTSHALDASLELAEGFIRSYYREMQAVEVKWEGFDHSDEAQWQLALSELNAVFRRYWLMETRFAEYWQSTLSSPPGYDISTKSVTTVADMLGNFAVMVFAEDRCHVYLISVVRDELKIVNQLFN